MRHPATAARAGLAAAALACGSVLLAACGSSGDSAAAQSAVTATVTATPPASTPPPATGPTITPPSGGPPACSTSGLSVKVGAGNAAAGSTFIQIVFTNTTSSSCSLLGYPGVSFVTGQAGRQVGSAAVRDPTQPARSIVVAAGGVAHATLRVIEALNYPEAGCKPTTVSTLKIFPPGQTAALYLAFPAQTCASTSSADQVLFIQAVGSGPGAST
jgi:Protein of unknown function (DUF4232)